MAKSMAPPGIEIRHANGVGSKTGPCAKHVKKNDAGARPVRLLKRKRNEPVEIAEIRRDQEHGRLSPSA